MNIIVYLVAYILIYSSRYLDQNERTFSVVESSCHLLVSVEPSKGRSISLSALPKDTTSELVYFTLLYLFDAERQAGKL